VQVKGATDEIQNRSAINHRGGIGKRVALPGYQRSAARTRGSATMDGILNVAVREIGQVTGASFGD
jgi:hypothetical protein